MTYGVMSVVIFSTNQSVMKLSNLMEIKIKDVHVGTNGQKKNLYFCQYVCLKCC
jgi:hypothetical protein